MRALRPRGRLPAGAAAGLHALRAIAALLVAGVAVALRNWAAAAVAALATLCLAAAVLPRAIGDGTVDPAGRETLIVLSANIHRGTADPDALVALVDRCIPTCSASRS